MVFLSFLLFLFLLFRASPMAYGGSQARGSNQSYSCLPQPQQCGIRATSATYTEAYGHSGSPTLSEARDQTCILEDTSQIGFLYASVEAPAPSFIELFHMKSLAFPHTLSPS